MKGFEADDRPRRGGAAGAGVSRVVRDRERVWPGVGVEPEDAERLAEQRAGVAGAGADRVVRRPHPPACGGGIAGDGTGGDSCRAPVIHDRLRVVDASVRPGGVGSASRGAGDRDHA